MLKAPAPLLLICTIALACDGPADDPREAQITNAVAHADEALIRTRPALVAGKWSVMSREPIDFYRGTLAIWADDWRHGVLGLATSRFALSAPLVPSVGDAHPENFGTMRAADGTFALEPNDFDAADRAPYLWDLRRLCAGMALAARIANADDGAARAVTAAKSRDIARAVAASYAEGVRRVAAGETLPRVDETTAGAIVADLFRRSKRDAAARAELPELTDLDGVTRTLKRGSIDPSQLDNVFADLPADVMAALPAAIAEYRTTLLAPPPPEYFTLLDAVREFGSGVSSWPKVRIILLVRGPSDDPSDDVLLELKELSDSTIAGLYPPGRYADDVRARVISGARSAWARPDAEPFWGVTTLLGLDAQIKTETEAFKTNRVSKMAGNLGTPAALTDLASTLGTLLARVHTARVDGTSAAQPIWNLVGQDPDGFADEQANVADLYAAEMLDDQTRFRRAVQKLGPSLGIPTSPSDLPTGDLAALYGTPPASPPPEAP